MAVPPPPHIRTLLRDPDPNLSAADKADYERWAKLFEYLATYEADSGKIIAFESIASQIDRHI